VKTNCFSFCLIPNSFSLNHIIPSDDTREEVVLLRHVILSHHGLLEYGSPVRPRVMEAEIIHMIDNLDASMMMMTTALALVDEGEMTNKVFAMDNRSFYKPKLD